MSWLNLKSFKRRYFLIKIANMVLLPLQYDFVIGHWLGMLLIIQQLAPLQFIQSILKLIYFVLMFLLDIILFRLVLNLKTVEFRLEFHPKLILQLFYSSTVLLFQSIFLLFEFFLILFDLARRR